MRELLSVLRLAGAVLRFAGRYRVASGLSVVIAALALVVVVGHRAEAAAAGPDDDAAGLQRHDDADGFADRVADRNADRDADRHADRNSDRHADRNADRYAERYGVTGAGPRWGRGAVRYAAASVRDRLGAVRGTARLAARHGHGRGAAGAAGRGARGGWLETLTERRVTGCWARGCDRPGSVLIEVSGAGVPTGAVRWCEPHGQGLCETYPGVTMRVAA